MRSFLAAAGLSGKKVALFCCHGGGKGGVFRHFREALQGNDILGERDFREPARKDPERNGQMAAEWAKDMVKRAGA